MKKTISTLFLSIVVFALHAQGFVHPGLLHTKQGLERKIGGAVLKAVTGKKKLF